MASTFVQIIMNLVICLCLLTRVSHSDCYRTVPSLPDAFSHIQSVYVPSLTTVYLFGTSDNWKTDTSMYTWDVSGSSQWIDHGLMLNGDDLFSLSNAVALIDNLLYFVGANPSVRVLDTNTNTWLDTSHIPQPPNGGAEGCVANNVTHLFYVGGTYEANPGDQLQIYDIFENTWSMNPITMTGITNKDYTCQMCWMHDNVLYVFGGQTIPVGGRLKDTIDIERIYTWHSEIGWEDIGSLPTASGRGIAEKHPLDNNILIIGGYGGGADIQNSIHQFSMETKEITNTYFMIRGLDGAGADFIGDDLFTFGGYDNAARTGATNLTQVCYGLVTQPTESPIGTTQPTGSLSTTASPTGSPTTSTQPSESPTTTTSPSGSPTTTRPPSGSPTYSSTTSITSSTAATTAIAISSTETETTSMITTASSTLEPSQPTRPTVFESSWFEYTTSSTSRSTFDEEDASGVTNSSTQQMYVMVGVAIGSSCITFICMVLVYRWYTLRGKRVKKLTDMMNGKNYAGHEVEVDAKTNKDDEDLVRVWLSSIIVLPQYYHSFITNGYDTLKFISRISDVSELIDIGITAKGHQRQIMSAIEILAVQYTEKQNDEIELQKGGDKDELNKMNDLQQNIQPQALVMSAHEDRFPIGHPSGRKGEKSVYELGAEDKPTVEGAQAVLVAKECRYQAKRSPDNLTIGSLESPRGFDV
eukprot:954912_1